MVVGVLVAVLGTALLGATLVGGASSRHPLAAGSSAPPAVGTRPPQHRPNDLLPGRRLGDVGRADGVVPDHVSVLDDDYPAVARLDPGLRSAVRRAATEAARDGVEVEVNSGWRSRRYQELLLREAVSRYGSAREAARWVATPDTSAHVSGDAIDVGPSDAATWLAEHGARYGLCRVYDDEPWHFELRAGAATDGCPHRYPDPTYDPRMQR